MEGIETIWDCIFANDCGYCGAAPEQNCVTTSGAHASAPHGRRSRPIFLANAFGYAEGLQDGQEWRRTARRV